MGWPQREKRESEMRGKYRHRSVPGSCGQEVTAQARLRPGRSSMTQEQGSWGGFGSLDRWLLYSDSPGLNLNYLTKKGSNVETGTDSASCKSGVIPTSREIFQIESGIIKIKNWLWKSFLWQ